MRSGDQRLDEPETRPVYPGAQFDVTGNADPARRRATSGGESLIAGNTGSAYNENVRPPLQPEVSVHRSNRIIQAHRSSPSLMPIAQAHRSGPSLRHW